MYVISAACTVNATRQVRYKLVRHTMQLGQCLCYLWV